MMFRVLTIFLLAFAQLAFADVTIKDTHNLTRASKRGVEQAKVTVIFNQNKPETIKLKGLKGFSKEMSPSGSSDQQFSFEKVPSGTWQVVSEKLNYKVTLE